MFQVRMDDYAAADIIKGWLDTVVAVSGEGLAGGVASLSGDGLPQPNR